MQNVPSPANVVFCYSFQNAPWFFVAPKEEEVKYFDKHFPTAMRNFFKTVRKNPNISPDTIIAPQLGGMSVGELSLLWLQARYVRRKTTDMKRKLALTEPQLGAALQEEVRTPSAKIKKLHQCLADPPIPDLEKM